MTATDVMSESGVARLASLEQRVETLACQLEEHGERLAQFAKTAGHLDGGEALSLIVFSGSLDRILSAFILATGAAAMGMPVSMFFTFWATTALRRNSAPRRKTWMEGAFGRLLPRGFGQLPLSHMNCLGAGPVMLRRVMKRKGVASLDEMLEISCELGVRIHVCAMTMDLLGIQREELVDYPEIKFCGVSSFLEQAELSKLTMFV